MGIADASFQQMARLLLSAPLILILMTGGCKYSHTVSPEVLALVHIREFRKAEQRFHERHGRYALLPELGGELAAPRTLRYDFAIVLTSTGYQIYAQPKVWNQSGRRSFLSDEADTIHECWQNRPATLQDPVLK